MAKNTQPVLKRCRTLGIEPGFMGIDKTSKRKPNQNRRKQSEYGRLIQEGWKAKAAEAGLDLEIGGILPMSHFAVKGCESPLVYKTFVTQEMLKRGYLASNSFYTSNAHSPEIIEKYLSDIGEVFMQIKSLMDAGISVESRLPGGVCQSGFGRLN